MARNTKTGWVLENMILPALQQGGYSAESQVYVGKRLGKKEGKHGRHKVDAIAKKDGRAVLLSAKWQQTGGTAEEKVPYEVMCLAQAIHDEPGKYDKAYLILGGDGWTLRDFYISGELRRYLNNTEVVEVVTLEKFVGLANRGML